MRRLISAAWEHKKLLAIVTLLAGTAYVNASTAPDPEKIAAALDACKNLGFSPTATSFDLTQIQRIDLEYPGSEKIRDAISCLLEFHKIGFTLLAQVIATINPDDMLTATNQLNRLRINAQYHGNVVLDHGQEVGLRTFRALGNAAHYVANLFPRGIAATTTSKTLALKDDGCAQHPRPRTH